MASAVWGPRWIRGIVARLLVYPCVAYVIAGGWLYLNQGDFLFPAPETLAKLTPAALGLRYDDLRIRVKAGGAVHAWWIPAASPTDQVLAVFHGNGYVLEDMLGSEVERLREIGANLLLVDYRGYGHSSRVSPDEATVLEDAEATLRYLVEERRVPDDRVLILGRSIGTGPATYLAATNPELGGLILESPFTSIDDVAKVAGPAWFQLFPIRLLLRTHFNNLARITSVTCPVLVVTGAADTLTPPSMAKSLFARAAGRKQLYVVPHAGHNDLLEVGGQALTRVLQDFVRQRQHGAGPRRVGVDRANLQLRVTAGTPSCDDLV